MHLPFRTVQRLCVSLISGPRQDAEAVMNLLPSTGNGSGSVVPRTTEPVPPHRCPDCGDIALTRNGIVRHEPHVFVIALSSHTTSVPDPFDVRATDVAKRPQLTLIKYC